MASDNYQYAVEEILKGVSYMVSMALKETTKCYDAIVLGQNADGSYTVKMNGDTHKLLAYGTGTINVAEAVKVIVPQGNMSSAFILPRINKLEQEVV